MDMYFLEDCAAMEKSQEHSKSGSSVVICRSSTMCEIHGRMCSHIGKHEESQECKRYCTHVQKTSILDKNCIGI